MLIDTHAHLNFNAYQDDVAEVIKRSLGNDVWMLNVGTQYSTSKRAVGIAGKYSQGVYAAVGLHPIYAEEKFHYEKFKALAQSPKVVAIGEIGLDYKPDYSLFKQKQKDLFWQQLNLVKELNLPVIFHCRMAHQDFLEILKSKIQNPKSKIKGVIHCFTGTWGQAEEYLVMGFYIGFNGLIFKMKVAETSSHLPPRAALPHSAFDEIIKKTPLNRILIETDCPYLTPPLKEGRNEPIYVKYVVEKIAKLKNMGYTEIAKITTQNAQKLFKLKEN